MPRKGAKDSGSDAASLAGSVTVVKGSITTPDDPTALDVKLSIWATEITMRADGAELGNWPSGSVVIRPIDAFNFEFIAEGDRLIFTPGNPDEFAQLPVVAGGGGSSKKRRRRSAKQKLPDQPPSLKWDETTAAEAQLRKKQADRGRSDRRSKQEKQAKQQKQAKPSRAERRAAKAAEAAASAERTAEPITAEPPPAEPGGVVDGARPDREEWMGQFGTVETPINSEPDAPDAALATDHSSVAVEAKPPKESLRHRAWIGTIDFARRYDLFGLDRVQVTAEQRQDPTHAHTWNHRVAPTSGPGKYVCTICGAIRRDQ